MSKELLVIKKSPPLNGTVNLLGAKNAVLPIMASLILTNGVSVLSNVPNVVKNIIIQARDSVALKTHYPYYSGLEGLESM